MTPQWHSEVTDQALTLRPSDEVANLGSGWRSADEPTVEVCLRQLFEFMPFSL